MIYKPGGLRKHSKELVAARNWGLGLVGAYVVYILLASEIQRIRGLRPELLNIAYIAVLAITGLLLFMWVWATQRELELLFEWLDPERYSPPSDIKETLLVLYFAAVLVGLMFAARDPLAYGVVLTAYSAVNLAANAHLNREIRRVLSLSRTRIEEDLSIPEQANRASLYAEGIKSLEQYYTARPSGLRILLILVSSGIGTGLAACWKLSGTTWLAVSAYSIFFTTLLVSELVIARWRCVRDAQLRLVEADLQECTRANDQ